MTKMSQILYAILNRLIIVFEAFVGILVGLLLKLATGDHSGKEWINAGLVAVDTAAEQMAGLDSEIRSILESQTSSSGNIENSGIFQAEEINSE